MEIMFLSGKGANEMNITADEALRLVEITQKKTNDLFEALASELRRSTPAATGALPSEDIRGTDPTAGNGQGVSDTWFLGDTTLSGGWEEVGRDSDITYTWPDGNLDEYDDFVSYRGTGGFSGLTLALGYLGNGDVIGFVLGAGAGSKRGITYFFPTDDFDETREKISMIRGGGPRGRSGFAPGEALPTGYLGFKTDVLRDRKAGKWNVQGVVAREDDHLSMLGHTALQARLRGLA
jgi:hypothetical protein